MNKTYDEESPKMLKSAVCFIDILGFSNMVEESCRNGQGDKLLNKLNNTIVNNIDLIKPYNKNFGSMKIFTDNIVIGRRILEEGESELGGTFEDFGSYQLALALDGFFVRGGVSVGDYYTNELISFGPALLKAHEIENSIAKNPRIVLDQKSRQLVETHLGFYSDHIYSPQRRDILEDQDGEWFINYLESAFVGESKYYYDLAYNLILKHKKVVKTKLEEFKDNPRVLEKYEWIRDYHNYFCEFKFEDSSKLKILEDDIIRSFRPID